MKFFLTILITLNLSLVANELAWVDEQIQAIKPSRDGIKSQDLVNVKNPFVKYTTSIASTPVVTQITKSASTKSGKKTITKKYIRPAGLKLTTIINQSVMINNKWYQQNKNIGKYTIKKVNHNNVILASKGQLYLLPLYSKKNKLKIRK